MFIVYTQKQKQLTLTEMILETKVAYYLLNVKFVLLVLALSVSQIPDLLQKYLFSDLSFLQWLTIAMVIDFVTGVTKSWKNEGTKSITSKGFRDTVSKCVQYGSFLMITHLLTHFRIGDQIVLGNFNWLEKTAYEFLILIEIKSVYENITAISPKIDFVKMILSKLTTLLKNTKTDEK